jgi:hypothetical protein
MVKAVHRDLHRVAPKVKAVHRDLHRVAPRVKAVHRADRHVVLRAKAAHRVVLRAAGRKGSFDTPCRLTPMAMANWIAMNC